MEKLCNSFDLNPPHVSPIPNKFPKSTSPLTCTFRVSCSNRSKSRHQKCRVLKIPYAVKNDLRSQLDKSGDSVGLNQGLIKAIGRGLVGFAAALAVCVDSPALAESFTVAFPVSPAHEVVINGALFILYFLLFI